MGWEGVLITVASAMAGVLVLLIGIVGNHLSRKIDRKLELKSLEDEVNRYIQWAQGSRTFELMEQPDITEVLVEQLREFAERYEISVTNWELRAMIKNSMSPLLRLEQSGRQLMQLKKE